MGKNTIIAVSDTTKEFIESVNDSLLDGIVESLERNEQSMNKTIEINIKDAMAQLEKSVVRKIERELSNLNKTSMKSKNESDEIKGLKSRIKQLEEKDKVRDDIMDRLVEQNREMLSLLKEFMEEVR